MHSYLLKQLAKYSALFSPLVHFCCNFYCHCFNLWYKSLMAFHLIGYHQISLSKEIWASPDAVLSSQIGFWCVYVSSCWFKIELWPTSALSKHFQEMELSSKCKQHSWFNAPSVCCCCCCCEEERWKWTQLCWSIGWEGHSISLLPGIQLSVDWEVFRIRKKLLHYISKTSTLQTTNSSPQLPLNVPVVSQIADTSW